ncbi:MAG: DUF1287 domain-containing protein, partial [candidate division Zixibacteria bacterium]|nr:DUF1287 domain-containing protein [candidate division Zixibacteria bacterium]NIW46926.1 DUF1287 domain-containing protein [Gammaproteobacteria bacterium]NIR65797.1 DUF1287 domain-containing protein [candidate division Zixibacteria bacterium]NIS47456.1 DUF1287 domain-containing protein [candidate division Zixibacteria bacterium]NIU15555.1 DUF1287 domain-containing protein [candidate division Zixibacteria bacterium]
GFCTDLIYDAYLWGANYNIQTALVKDAISNPDHFYRWRDARNAHDMWRYFAYTDQMIWENTEYTIGDIVFFDWEDNSEIDHVAIVSEVWPSGKPKSLIDATGKINFNPSGLTGELPWLAFHDT